MRGLDVPLSIHNVLSHHLFYKRILTRLEKAPLPTWPDRRPFFQDTFCGILQVNWAGEGMLVVTIRLDLR